MNIKGGLPRLLTMRLKTEVGAFIFYCPSDTYVVLYPLLPSGSSRGYGQNLREGVKKAMRTT